MLIIFRISLLYRIHIKLKVLFSSTLMLIMSMHCIHLKVMLIHIILIKFIQIVMIRSIIITKLNFILVFYRRLRNFIIQPLNIVNVNFIGCCFIILSII